MSIVPSTQKNCNTDFSTTDHELEQSTTYDSAQSSSESGTDQGAVMLCGWEGNRRGVALAMRHRLQWFIHVQAHSL